MLAYEEFHMCVSDFLRKKGWNETKENEEIVFSKGYSSYISSKRKIDFLLDDKKFYMLLSSAFQKIGLKREVLNSMKNEKKDTDFIIAALQIANSYFSEKNYNVSFYSFQPVTRFNRLDKSGTEDGFLSSFVNIATVDIGTSIDNYLQRLDDWLSIFSMLSLHTSGFKLKLKPVAENRIYNNAEFNNGMKIKFCYKGLDIGVANLFDVNVQQQNLLVSDFGSSYERLLWSVNGMEHFYAPLIPHVEFFLEDKKKNDRIRTATLMVMTGVLPSAKGSGVKIRSIIREVTDLRDELNILRMVDHYYQYYSKFIQPSLSLEQTKNIICTEVEYNKKLLIDHEKADRSTNQTLDDLCVLRLIRNTKAINFDILKQKKRED